MPTTKSPANRALEAAFRRAEIGDVSSHNLRKTFATRLLSRGAAITDIQHLLGHASVKTTERAYAAFVKNERYKLTIDLLDEPRKPELALAFTDTSDYFVSESSVYRILKVQDLITSPAFVVIKAASELRDKTTAPNQLWQTDFTYFKVIGWGWFYLSTILDDYSHYIIAWKLCTSMRAEDVTETLRLALKASGCDQAKVAHGPRLLSDNGSSCISGDLAAWLEEKGMEHACGAPHPPQTQGKLKRWRITLKNRVLLETYYLPGALENRIGSLVDHYNHHRKHESLGNLTPADVYYGRAATILETEGKDQETNPPKPSLSASATGGITSTRRELESSVRKSNPLSHLF